jgi:hypothetical protein
MKYNTVVGVWDSSFVPPSLGGILTFIENICVVKKIYNVDICRIYALGTQNPLLSLFNEFSDISGLHFVEKRESFLRRDFPKTLFWPTYHANFTIDNTILIQSFFKKYKYIPYLSIKEKHSIWVNNIFNKYVKNKIPVIVHLKNNPNCTHCSNARFQEWFQFFKSIVPNKQIIFLLIGNDEVPSQIEKLPNVVLTNRLNSTLAQDLACILNGKLFMGTASGPCNMALFSKTPYIIFKDPEHHTQGMRKEMGDKDQYIFAQSDQFLYRRKQTFAFLSSTFHNWYSRI